MHTQKKFGTAPVFFTAISTILGAILFLRFGFAVGTLGFWGVILIILLGHIVTIPTALALSEIATNKRVEGGGEYYIVSRSFGLNIGATIGVVLYLSQAISVAFYVIAFTEAFSFLFDFLKDRFDFILPRQVISVPVMLFLASLIIRKGANMGVKALYLIVGILAFSILMFFLGSSNYAANSSFSLANAEFRNMGSFFLVFAIIFPAFTGMTAGVGLSGDLKNPAKSIPLGTIAAIISGMVIYFLIAYKLASSASPAELANNQMVMADIAVWGFLVVPLGLAAATISSALGSVMVAPRTLQALATDKSFPSAKINEWLSKNREKDGEPVNASIVTCVIAFFFVLMGDVNIVAQIISMFFMVTYGSICLISFLNHFGSSPSYRPSFKSRWVFSLIGFIASIWIMFQISVLYTVLALVVLVFVYVYINYLHKNRKGLESIFANAIFQLNRWLQVYIQRKKITRTEKEWRPSAICISKNSFKYDNAFRLLNWLSYKFGFGTYLHFIKDYYSRSTSEQAKQELEKILKNIETENSVYVDTIVSPSNTSAIVQAIQLPGIAGMENNMLIFDFDKEDPDELDVIIDNYRVVNAGDFDICVLAVSRKPVFYKNGIHVWIKTFDELNANLMILMSFIILGHPDWKRSNIKIHYLCREEEVESVQMWLDELIVGGRMPIFRHNIEIVIREKDIPVKKIIGDYSSEAGLTIIGFISEDVKQNGREVFEGYDKLGNVLFVNACSAKIID
ncbi:MAG: amino acid permease [Paludibacter sp.]|nr:amino acid permease [Paludibacter sp.]MDD4427797.1 amino acid permease [Paludibacter sp.]